MENGKTSMVLTPFRDVNDLKVVLFKQHQKSIENFFGDPDRALEFMSNVAATAQRIPLILECTPASVINSFLTMASLKLMPSGISGEAYVLPYKNRGVYEAQFQLGYQGLVTLFYRAGCRSIIAEIVYEKDEFGYENGVVHHKANIFSKDRGSAIGAYVIVETQQGGKVAKAMSRDEIIGMAERFSKSYFEWENGKQTEKVGKYTPWNEDNDPNLWMWKKTVLKQAAKLVPKNETIFKAIAADNEDSIINDRLKEAAENADSLKMGNLALPHGNNQKAPQDQDGVDAPAGDDVPNLDIGEGS